MEMRCQICLSWPYSWNRWKEGDPGVGARAGNYGLKRTPRIFHWIFVDYWNFTEFHWIIGIFWILWNIIGLLDFSMYQAPPLHSGRFGKNFGIKSNFRLFWCKTSCQTLLSLVIPKITWILSFVRPGGNSQIYL
jgi:hypothetical protein